MGPLALMDLIGLDTMLNIGEVLFAEFRDARYAPPPLLRRMVAAGRLGRKSGGGFYPGLSGAPNDPRRAGRSVPFATTGSPYAW